MNQINDKLKNISEEEKSDWKQILIDIDKNGWLEYSSEIARRIIAKIRSDKKLTQAKLAEIMAVEPQQISKIIKGNENLTLKTIYNLAKALNVELITFPEYEYSQKYICTSSNTFTSTTEIMRVVNDSKVNIINDVVNELMSNIWKKSAGVVELSGSTKSNYLSKAN